MTLELNKKGVQKNVVGSNVRVERKRQTMLIKFIYLNSAAVAVNCDNQRVVRMRNRDK